MSSKIEPTLMSLKPSLYEAYKRLGAHVPFLREAVQRLFSYLSEYRDDVGKGCADLLVARGFVGKQPDTYSAFTTDKYCIKKSIHLSDIAQDNHGLSGVEVVMEVNIYVKRGHISE